MESRWTEQDHSGEPVGDWFSYAAPHPAGTGGGEPPGDAYSRFTDSERFLPLHDWALEALAQLQREYEVVRDEGEGMGRPAGTPPAGQANDKADAAPGHRCAHHHRLHRLPRP